MPHWGQRLDRSLVGPSRPRRNTETSVSTGILLDSVPRLKVLFVTKRIRVTQQRTGTSRMLTSVVRLWVTSCLPFRPSYHVSVVYDCVLVTLKLFS